VFCYQYSSYSASPVKWVHRLPLVTRVCSSLPVGVHRYRSQNILVSTVSLYCWPWHGHLSLAYSYWTGHEKKGHMPFVEAYCDTHITCLGFSSLVVGGCLGGILWCFSNSTVLTSLHQPWSSCCKALRFAPGVHLYRNWEIHVRAISLIWWPRLIVDHWPTVIGHDKALAYTFLQSAQWHTFCLS
jgi:hypothetical protein